MDENKKLISLEGLSVFKDNLDSEIDDKIAQAGVGVKYTLGKNADGEIVLTGNDGSSTKVSEADPTVPAYVKAIKESDITSWNNKVNKEVGKSLIADTEIERLSNVDNYNDSALSGRVKTLEDDGYITADAISALQTTVGALPTSYAPVNAQANVIETIKVNNTAITPSSKAVNITVPTKASDIGAQTALSTAQLNAVNSGITSTKVSTYDGYAATIASKAGTGVVSSSKNGLLSTTQFSNMAGQWLGDSAITAHSNATKNSCSWVRFGTITGDKINLMRGKFTLKVASTANTDFVLATVNSGYRPGVAAPLSVYTSMGDCMVQGWLKADGTITIRTSKALTVGKEVYISAFWSA